MPPADVIVHSGDFTHCGTEQEVLDFLNWFIALDYPHKIFVAGNHDMCLWNAEMIEDLPTNVHFLQDRGVTIDGVKFFGLGYNHPVKLIDPSTNVLVTHEPPIEILDYSSGVHWGNLPLRNCVEKVKPRLHLFGHAHESYGGMVCGCVQYSNASLLNDQNQQVNSPRLIDLRL